ncbi:MAG: HAD-IIB family hydrolase [Oscillospiraceae bacterium]|nr:HAD-IIB family hydrolase [Oscillospiraceae bacterium]
MKPYAGKLLITDIDGTLITPEFTFPERNREAIARFVEGGGLFSLATGRSLVELDLVLERYGLRPYITAPVILSGGSSIYDLSARKALDEVFIHSSGRTILAELMDLFPHTGVYAYTNEEIFVLRPCEMAENRFDFEGLSRRPITLEELPEKIFRYCFVDDSDIIWEIILYTQRHAYRFPNIDFLRTERRMQEIIPININKGLSLRKLAALLDIPLDHTFAVGDYYNDAELLALAGHSFTPSNAPEDIQALAEKVVCHCSEGAVADVIDLICR